MEKVPKIGTGKCSGCGQSERLLDGACGECRKRYGRNCGYFMVRVRSDPRFAMMCYRALPGDHERKKFVEMFGDPRTSIAER